MVEPMFKKPKTSKRKPRRKLEEKSSRELIKEADKWFSKYIRLRDAVYRDDIAEAGWYGQCVTCSKQGLICDGEGHFQTGWNAGHFVTRGHMITRFDEQNVHLQCAFRCNNMRSGEYEKHRVAIDKMYGEGTAASLENLARTSLYKLQKFQLLNLVSSYKHKVNEILNKESRYV